MAWLYRAIDLLASEYGWAKNDILETVFFDDLYYLSRQINYRKINQYRMSLAIAQNPHIKENKAIWQELDKQERELLGKSYLDSEFDQTGFELLKQKLRANPRFIVK